MLVGFTRYSRDQSFAVIGTNGTFVTFMAAGSITGAYVGGRLLGVVPNMVLLPSLSLILVVSAVKTLRVSDRVIKRGECRACSGRFVPT
jgi:uncharacterized membrane protein YfcA